MIQRQDVLYEFDKEHHGEHGPVRVDDWLLFADGARRSLATYGPLGQALTEPSPKEDERRKWQKLYWETRLESLVEQFESLKASARNNAVDSPGRFKSRMEELKKLQSLIRSARSILNHLTIQERGYTQVDVSRAWEVWEAFAQASREESEARQKYESALLGKSSPGVLEKLKRAFDIAKKRSARTMDAWNSFTPIEARGIVGQQLDATHVAERLAELDTIEV